MPRKLGTPCDPKYVFFDVVGFTKLPSINVQITLIHAIRVTVEMLSFELLDEDHARYIPTGDGMCIALLNAPFDVHMRFAKALVNEFTKEFPNYHLRVGVGHGLNDFMFTDINGRDNFAGQGINDTARAMQAAEIDTVYCTEMAHKALSQHQMYQGCWTKVSRRIKQARYTFFRYDP